MVQNLFVHERELHEIGEFFLGNDPVLVLVKHCRELDAVVEGDEPLVGGHARSVRTHLADHGEELLRRQYPIPVFVNFLEQLRANFIKPFPRDEVLDPSRHLINIVIYFQLRHLKP